MREINLSKFNVRTDIVNDLINDKISTEEKIKDKNVTISRIYIDKNLSKKINREVGNYTTIYFKDITDSTNFKRVYKHFYNELSLIIKKNNIKDNESILVVGLGNENSTPDSLGVKTTKSVIVTKHINDITGMVEDGYKISSIFIPGVMGKTGIESSELLNKVIEIVNPNFIIVIDALASSSIDRLCKCIQITDTGINPGSGIGNNRKEISFKSTKTKVIAIGVPMVVDAVTIVSDTIDYIKKHFSYSINSNENKDKLIPSNKINYLDFNKKLTNDQNKYLLGEIGFLTDEEKKSLLYDVLYPVNKNLIVTPNDVDFLIERLVKLLSKGINNIIHYK